MQKQTEIVELSLSELEAVAGGTQSTEIETPTTAVKPPQMAAAAPVAPNGGNSTDMPIKGV
ncbi:hypothetical protein [Chitinimonas lacunae]|uniref:Bacteriocin n=1 Tax=Chitinimonas lacunae TaxID=1963018 RepID=A0ABV8MLT3_9NEIS